MLDEIPNVIATVGVKYTVFAPETGVLLKGSVVDYSETHIGRSL